MAEVGSPDQSRQKRGHKKKHKSKRLGVRIDMTPMVDVAFLLLTFFMLTTAFMAPQTMEINLPPKDVTVPVAQSNVMILRVMDTGDLYWNLGDDKPAKVSMRELHDLLVSKKQEKTKWEGNEKKDKLVVLIKVDRKAKYTSLVDVMDELNLADITRFSIAPFLDADREEVLKAI